MLRELVMHDKIREIPGYMRIMPEGMVTMTRKEMNDRIDEIFRDAARDAREKGEES